MLACPVPVRILGAAQFHEFVGHLVDWGTQAEVSYVPSMRTERSTDDLTSEPLV